MNPLHLSPRPTSSRCRWGARLGAVLGLMAMGVASGQEPVTVTVVRPTRGEITRFVALPGTLRANQQVTLQARVAGFIKSMAVDRGDRVAAGQLLAEIEVPELLADRARQVAEVKVAEAEARRLESGRAKAPDLVVPQALDAAVGRLEIARAELEKTETLLRYARLTAPFPGVITARFLDPGAFVPAGAVDGASALVTLADTRILRAQVHVPEVEALLVRTGLPVRVGIEGMTNLFPAAVSRHTGALDESTRSLLVEADLPNDAGLLRPGMFATVQIGLEQHSQARLVPTAGLLAEKASLFVFRVDNGVCRKTAVKGGFQDGANTEVISGIGDDTGIILPARSAPADGTPVRVKEVR